MPRARRTQQPGLLNGGTLINILAIPLLTGALTFLGFYFTTKDTLTQHTQEISNNNKAREQLREALLDNANKTQLAISTLAATARVQEEQIKGVNGSLERIERSIEKLGK
jgi:hypothetical protein